MMQLNALRVLVGLALVLAVVEARPPTGHRRSVVAEEIPTGSGGKAVEIVEVSPVVRVLKSQPQSASRPTIETGHRVRGRPPVHNVPVLGEIIDKDPVAIDEYEDPALEGVVEADGPDGSSGAVIEEADPDKTIAVVVPEETVVRPVSVNVRPDPVEIVRPEPVEIVRPDPVEVVEDDMTDDVVVDDSVVDDSVVDESVVDDSVVDDGIEVVEDTADEVVEDVTDDDTVEEKEDADDGVVIEELPVDEEEVSLDHKAEELDFEDRTGNSASGTGKGKGAVLASPYKPRRPIYQDDAADKMTTVKTMKTTLSEGAPAEVMTTTAPKTGLSGGLIALIVILALAVVAAIVGLCIGCSKKKDDMVAVTPVPITEPVAADGAAVATPANGAPPGTDTPAN